MDQVLAIQKVKEKIKKALDCGDYDSPEKMSAFLREIDNDLEVFLA